MRIVAMVYFTLQMLLPGFSEAGSLKESLDAIRANASSVTSGSITYDIVSFRPKENLLGASSRSGNGEPGIRHIGEKDATLPGKGWVKWNKDSVIAETTRYVLVPVTEGSLATRIEVVRESSTPDGSKFLRTTFQTNQDALARSIEPCQHGSVVEQIGSEQGPAKFQGSLTFKQLQYVILPLLSKNFLLNDKYISELKYSEADNLCNIQRSNERSFTLDPNQGFLPVQEVIGLDKPYMNSSTKFTSTGNFWLPETNRTEYWEGTGLRYAVTCTTLSHETGRNYPPEDFTITFPPGTEMDDRYDSGQ